MQSTTRNEIASAGRSVEPHVPLDRLPDGVWLYAPLGQVLVVAAGSRVVCHACGEPLAAVTRHHLRHHDLDVAGYRERFGLNRKQSLLSPDLAEVRRTEGHARWATNEAVRDGLAIGQDMARTGRLYELGAAAQPPGARRRQGRAPASREGAAPALRQHRDRQSQAARKRWEQRARGLGYEGLDDYLKVRRAESASPWRVRTELGCGGSVAQRLLGDLGPDQAAGAPPGSPQCTDPEPDAAGT